MYNYFEKNEYEIVEKKLCHNFGQAETPFIAVAVKTGFITDKDGRYSSDIIKWMTEEKYNMIMENE